MGVDPISIGLMAAGTLIQGFGAFKSAEAQKKQMRAQQASADMQAQNQRLEQVRQGRIARAKVIQMGENQGAGGSSSVTSAAGNATGQANANIGYINEQQDIGKQITSAQQQQVDWQTVSNIGKGLSSVGNVFGSK